MILSNRLFFRLSGLFYLLAASLHLVRVVVGWEFTMAGSVVPMYVSWIVVVIGFVMAFENLYRAK